MLLIQGLNLPHMNLKQTLKKKYIMKEHLIYSLPRKVEHAMKYCDPRKQNKDENECK